MQWGFINPVGEDNNPKTVSPTEVSDDTTKKGKVTKLDRMQTWVLSTIS